MKTNKILLTLAFALCTTFVFAQISGTSHDMSGAAWNTEGEICITCHTPHNALGTAGAPLWNHASSTETYTLYDTPTLDATDLGQPGGTSKLCLGCHDGTVDLEAYGGVASTGAGALITGDALLGTDLSIHHPVSFSYNAALLIDDPGLHDPAGVEIAALLFSEQVECASCHDAHDNSEGGFLRMSNAASALCLTCHNK